MADPCFDHRGEAIFHFVFWGHPDHADPDKKIGAWLDHVIRYIQKKCQRM